MYGCERSGDCERSGECSLDALACKPVTSKPFHLALMQYLNVGPSIRRRLILAIPTLHKLLIHWMHTYDHGQKSTQPAQISGKQILIIITPRNVGV